MKNLNPYKKDCFAVHSKAISKKEDEQLRLRLYKLDDIIKKQYEHYSEKFDANKLNEVVSEKEAEKSKADLLTLYSYQSSVVKSVRKEIQELQVKTIINTCQNCTVTPVSTMDHILPQSKFPEFIVNPRNLFPCCHICNGHKLAAVPKGEERLFLNLYLDSLPEKQYLFAKVWLDKDNEIDFLFYLENVNDIDKDLYKLIESHYAKLHLFERIKLKAIEGKSEFFTHIKEYNKVLPIDKIKEVEFIKIGEDRKAYGFNHWKCVLEEALLNSDEFIRKVAHNPVVE